MEFKINFAYFVSLFLLVFFSINLADVICTAICNKRKKKLTEEESVFNNLLDYVDCCQRDFLIKEHGFTDEQLADKSGKELCAECGYKHTCKRSYLPCCLDIHEDFVNDDV